MFEAIHVPISKLPIVNYVRLDAPFEVSATAVQWSSDSKNSHITHKPLRSILSLSCLRICGQSENNYVVKIPEGCQNVCYHHTMPVLFCMVCRHESSEDRLHVTTADFSALDRWHYYQVPGRLGMAVMAAPLEVEKATITSMTQPGK